MSATWNELLPVSVTVGGVEYPIRSDYRACLDICMALSDPELNGADRAEAALDIFYPEFDQIPPEHYKEAVSACLHFLGGGQEEQPGKGKKLVDWEQDFPYIVAPVNRILGQEVRAAEYIHWWTFLSSYMEIGECTFTQIVRIRDRLSSGKSLDKQDRAWYRKNRALVDFKRKYTSADEALMKEWGGA